MSASPSVNTVLVTGGAGYIGSVLVPKLLAEGVRVVVLDRFFFGRENLAPHANLRLVQADSRRIDASLFEGVDAVIDLVAISNDPSGELFQQATREINHLGRVRTCELARAAGVQRYILPSSCSIYGFQDGLVTETSPTNPLTEYARANERAEAGVLPLATDAFCVTVMRQGTIYGYGARMRYDLAINGMVYGAWSTKRLPLMRDGTQYRPMLHVQDTTDVMIRLLRTDPRAINGERFNIGGEESNYQLGLLGETIALVVSGFLGENVAVEWYGDPDHRSYKVGFEKIERVLGWKPAWDAERGALDLLARLQAGTLEKTPKTITLGWYQELVKWHAIIRDVGLHGGILDIDAGL